MKVNLEQAKVLWNALDSAGDIHEGELTPITEGVKIADIEAELFNTVNNLPNPTQARFRVLFPDGSGHISRYVKRGPIWIKASSDNIMPTWFAHSFMIFFAITVIVLFVLSILEYMGKI